MNHTERLNKLEFRGWICDHPNAIHNPVARDGAPHRAVSLEGRIHDVPQSIFLGIETGIVMLIRGPDFTFEGFLKYCDAGPVKQAAVDTRHKSLFGDEE
jgi:hypothetical protein